MSEVLENGASFGTGRKKLNAFFSATTDAEIIASGVSLNRLIVGTMSADTIYSAGTSLEQVFNSSGAFRQEVITGSVSGITNYALYRDYHGQSSITSTLYVSGNVSVFSIDFLPVSPGKVFKFQWYSQAIKEIPVGYVTAEAGQIQFNSFDVSATTETFSINGNNVGQYDFLNDPAGGLTYNSTLLPGLSTSGITATFYPDSGAEETLESGVTRVYVVKGLLM